jgi:hypothetical protein
MPLLAIFLFLGAQGQLYVVPAGTSVSARLESRVQTATSNAGDLITAVLADSIRIGDRVVVPQGSRLNGRVETVEAADSVSQGRVRLVFRELRLPDGRPMSTWITNSFSASMPNRKRRYVLNVAIGSVVGALIGGKSARTAGVLGGALIGFVIAGNADDGGKLRDLELKPDQRIRLQLQQELRVDSLTPAAH